MRDHCKVSAPLPEEPGEFCFPPIASSITAGARLLLGLLQTGVEERGGTYLACDTPDRWGETVGAER